MNRAIPVTLVVFGCALIAHAQTSRVWTSNSDQRWNRNQNWSGSNAPNTNSEVAVFGSGLQLNPELNANNIVVRGIQFSAGAAGYDIGDDTGSRTLTVGNATSGFITQLSTNQQTISVGTLSFQSSATFTTATSGGLVVDSRLTGSNRNLTFDANGTINVSGAITTGSGTLTKLGAGDLVLSGANTYSGTTTINAGAIVAGANNLFANTARVDVASGAALKLDGFSDVIGRLTGIGTVDFGSAGTGQLTLNSGTSQFGGVFTGAGRVVVGAGATLTLGADFDNAGLHITLAGGRLNLAGSHINLASLDVTADSIVDFSGGLDSWLGATTLGIAGSASLSVRNWSDAADYFVTDTVYPQGQAPLDQVVFQGWSSSDTKWLPFGDRGQISPVPELRWSGALLLMIGLLSLGRRRRGRGVPHLRDGGGA